MTPIKPGTAERLGLRKPQPSFAQTLATFVRKHIPEHTLQPWQLYVLEELGWRSERR